MEFKWGCHRFVIILDNIVIKFPNPIYYKEWFIKGFKGNIQEAKLSKTNKALCPVLFCFPFGLFLIMRKAESIDYNIDLDEFMRINNIKTAENKMESFGIINGSIVCIDYENK